MLPPRGSDRDNVRLTKEVQQLVERREGIRETRTADHKEERLQRGRRGSSLCGEHVTMARKESSFRL